MTANANFRRSIPFTMYRVSAMAAGLANEDFSQFDLTIHGVRVLIVTLQNPRIRIGEVADITCIERSTLSHMLRRMERDGLLVRKRLTDDNRSATISLTVRGKRVAQAVEEIVLEHQRALMQGISREHFEVFRSVLDRMAANLETLAERRRTA
jgi:DNA-binding MarR family transcriptional regulator